VVVEEHATLSQEYQEERIMAVSKTKEGGPAATT
jgi:hypothetical protein